MHNLTTGKTVSKQAEATNNRLIRDGITYDFYSTWIPASEFQVYDAKSVFVAPNAGVPAYWKFGAGKVCKVMAYTRRHQEWRRGSLCAKLHWSANTVPSTYNLTLGVKPAVLNALFSAETNRTFATTSKVINTLNVTQLVSPDTQLDSKTDFSHAGIVLVVGRDGRTDAVAGDVALYGVEMIYRERINQAGIY